MDRSQYPAGPGVRSTATGGTSEAAAEFIAPHVAGLCKDVLAYLAQGPASPEELAAKFAADGRPVLLTTIRARTSQLSRLGYVTDSGLRGMGESLRVRVIKWRLNSRHEQQAYLAAKAEKGGAG